MLAAIVSARSDERVTLKPGATVSFEFPELPETLASMTTGQKKPARMTVQLPDNYSPDCKFPLMVFLGGTGGGEMGGQGEEPTVARVIAGPHDFYLREPAGVQAGD